MTEFKRVFLAGAYSGVILGVVMFLVSPGGWRSGAVAFSGQLLLNIVGGIFVGATLGLPFLIVYEYLPSDRVWVNGIFFSIVLWLVVYVWGTSAFSSLEMSKYLVYVVVNLPPMVLYGYFLGLFYGRLEEKRERELDEFMEKVRS